MQIYTQKGSPFFIFRGALAVLNKLILFFIIDLFVVFEFLVDEGIPLFLFFEV